MVTDMTTDAASPQTQPWIADDSTFGARLALIRQRMGWGNVKTAATECGLPPESWRHWERDGLEPRRLVTIALAIATRTGCDYLWLVHGPKRGGAIRSVAYSRQSVLAAVGAPRPHRPNTDRLVSNHTRPVTQTRPTGRVSVRPKTPVAV